MKKQIILLGIAGALAFVTGCQKSEDVSNEVEKEPVVVTEPQHTPEEEPIVENNEEKTQDSEKDGTEKDLESKAKETVENILNALKNEDIQLYKSVSSEQYNELTAGQTEMMFEQYDLSYEIVSIDVKEADEKNAVVIAQYRVMLKTGEKDSFSDNESQVEYTLELVNGDYKIVNHELLDVQHFAE